MSALHRDHFVHGQYTRKGGRLTFRAENQTTYDAQQAMRTGTDFTVCLPTPERLQDVTGRVESIELVLPVTIPQKWEIVIVEHPANAKKGRETR